MNNIIKKLRRRVAPWYKNLRGWKTGRKIVVIESDDWGSIRMPSRQVYERCLKAGYKVDQNVYEKYDSLASEDDLELLFDLLSSFKDKNENHPVITANVLTSNPDFDKIKENGFKEYYYESIKKTFKRYPKHEHCFNLWNNGLKQGVFYPQSHGREHLNVSKFMNALQQEQQDVLFGFKHGIPGCIPRGEIGGNEYMEALNYTDEQDKQKKLKIFLEGFDLFEKLFNYRSESFIPPTYLWSPDFDEKVSKAGVRFYQGNRRMKEPRIDDKGINMHSHVLGETNKFGQLYLIRNAVFEPTIAKKSNVDNVNQCLKQIHAAFTMKKPAIVCSHRLNYVGYLDEKNRDRNLKMLKNLLAEILKKWPDVEFMTSDKLGIEIQKMSKK